MRVLLALDGSERSDSAAGAIAAWARQTGAEIHIVSIVHPDDIHETAAPTGFTHAMTPGGTPSGQRLDVHEPLPTMAEDRTQAITRAIDERRDHLRSVARTWFADLSVEITVEGSSNTAEAIVARARTAGADFIAMATRARGGIGAALFGSTHEAVVRQAPMPVLLVGPEAMLAPR